MWVCTNCFEKNDIMLEVCCQCKSKKPDNRRRSINWTPAQTKSTAASYTPRNFQKNEQQNNTSVPHLPARHRNNKASHTPIPLVNDLHQRSPPAPLLTDTQNNSFHSHLPSDIRRRSMPTPRLPDSESVSLHTPSTSDEQEKHIPEPYVLQPKNERCSQPKNERCLPPKSKRNVVLDPRNRKINEVPQNRKQNALAVVAIDFGTSFSGYAFALCNEYKNDKNKIKLPIWQSGVGSMTNKTPTVILFDEKCNFKSFGYQAEQEYTDINETKSNSGYRYFSHFKIKLYRAESGRKQRIEKLVDVNGKEMDALVVFSDSIKFFRDHFLQYAQTSGLKFLVSDIFWVITIPAIWKDEAKQFMRVAAKGAGLPDELLTLAYEPEAAAIYCKNQSFLDSNSVNRNIRSFENGQQFLVLDCGGGTVDVTCYEITDDFCLLELESPTGGPWGGDTVNNEYFKFVKQVFGADVWNKFVEENPEDLLEITKMFEIKKKCINESSVDSITIAFPHSFFQTFKMFRGHQIMTDYLQQTGFSKSIFLKHEKLRFESNCIKDCFAKSIKSIVEHVQRLLRETHLKKIQTILMVGGFSQSDLLYNRIVREFLYLNVVRPTDADLAVLKGAVMYGNDQSLIRQRICPRTYGISVNVPFDPQLHLKHLKVIIEGQEKCTDIFKTLVKTLIVGESVFEVTCHPTRSTDTEASVDIYETSLYDPQYTCQEEVRPLGTLSVPIPDVEKGKQRPIKVQIHFGYTELFVTVTEKGTVNQVKANFKCL